MLHKLFTYCFIGTVYGLVGSLFSLFLLGFVLSIVCPQCGYPDYEKQERTEEIR